MLSIEEGLIWIDPTSYLLGLMLTQVALIGCRLWWVQSQYIHTHVHTHTLVSTYVCTRTHTHSLSFSLPGLQYLIKEEQEPHYQRLRKSMKQKQQKRGKPLKAKAVRWFVSPEITKLQDFKCSKEAHHELQWRKTCNLLVDPHRTPIHKALTP